MSERTIVCEIAPDMSLKLDPADAEFLQLRPGARLVISLQQTRPAPGAPMHAKLTVAEGGTKRVPKAFQS